MIIHRNLNFNTKEEYQRYITNWKLDYKVLSENIQKKKKLDKRHQRYYSQAFLIHWINGDGTSWNDKRKNVLREYEDRTSRDEWLIRHDKIFEKTYGQWCNKLTLSILANNMLAELKLAKKESQRQYLAQQKQELTIV